MFMYHLQVTEQHPADVEAWIELAQILEETDINSSNKAYQTAISIYKKDINSDLPAEMLNNIASLLYR